jgi:predicted cupin superfamily sugar epimerase
VTGPAERPSHPRARRLIEELGLTPHPEGGWYREVYRSAGVVRTAAELSRPSLTTIYFLLSQGGISRWHRLAADEVWHWYEGDPLDLYAIRDGERTWTHRRLGLMSGGAVPVSVVPAGTWQAARSAGSHTLVGCTVAPGFTFDDFTLARNDPAAMAWLGDLGEEVKGLL